MGHGYQKRDYEILDYQLWTSPEFKRPFRGPQPASLEPGKYFSCLGGAQTFGCFTEKPFPQLLSEKLELPVFNAGVAGAGPLWFLSNKRILDFANHSKFVIIQLMSGRSESNRVFISIDGRGRLTRKSDGKVLMAEAAYREFLDSSPREVVAEIVDETRGNYVKHMIELLNLISVPKILFWFSERKPEYEEGFDDVRRLFGKYPQLVNREMLEHIRPFADVYMSKVFLPKVCLSS